MTQSDRQPRLELVEEPQRPLGESMAALASTNYDELDLILRPHLNPERTRSQMALARRLLFGEEDPS